MAELFNTLLVILAFAVGVLMERHFGTRRK